MEGARGTGPPIHVDRAAPRPQDLQPSALSEGLSDGFYHLLVDLEEKYKLDLDVPRLVCIGTESSGKSTLLEYILGFSVAFKKVGTATRCPSQLTLKKVSAGHDADEVKVTFNGEAIRATDLASNVKTHMEGMGSSFSDEMLRIEVSSASVPDLVLVDLPGLIIAPRSDRQEESKKVEKMVARFVRDPLNILLVVGKCLETVTSFHEVKLVEKLATDDEYLEVGRCRNNWNESSIFIMNFFNTTIGNTFTDIRQANDFFECARSHDHCYRFVSLRPTNDVSIDTMSYDASKEYYKDLPGKEREFYDENIKKLEGNPDSGGSQWNPLNYEMLGVKRAVDAMVHALNTKLGKQTSSIHMKLTERRERAVSEMEVLKCRKNSLDPKEARAAVGSFLMDFRDNFQRSAQGKETRTKGIRSTNQDSDSLLRSRIQTFTYEAEEFGVTFEEELEETPYFGKWDGFLSIGDLKSPRHLGNKGQQLGDLLDKKLLPVASFRRALNIFEYMLLAKDFDNITNDNIYNAACVAKSESNFPSNEVVMQMAVKQLKDGSDGVHWLCKLIRRRFYTHALHVFDHLIETAQYVSLPQGVKALFQAKILTRFNKLMALQLNKAEQQYYELLETFEEHRPVDKMRKQLMLHLVLSLQDMIPDPRMLKVRDPDSGPSAPEEAVPGSNLWFDDESLAIPRQGKYPVEEDENRSSEPEERNVRLLKDFGMVARHLENFKGRFNIADIVEPGIQQVFPQDWRMINYDYIRACSRKYYCAFVIDAIQNVDRFWTTQFLHYMTSTYKDDLGHDLEELKEDLLGLSKDEWDEAMGDGGAGAIEDQIVLKEGQIKDLSTALLSLQRSSSRLPVLERSSPTGATRTSRKAGSSRSSLGGSQPVQQDKSRDFAQVKDRVFELEQKVNLLAQDEKDRQAEQEKRKTDFEQAQKDRQALLLC